MNFPNQAMQPTAGPALCALQFSIRFIERNDAFDTADRIQNMNLTGAKPRAVFRIIDCLIPVLVRGKRSSWHQHVFTLPLFGATEATIFSKRGLRFGQVHHS